MKHSSKAVATLLWEVTIVGPNEYKVEKNVSSTCINKEHSNNTAPLVPEWKQEYKSAENVLQR